MWNILGKAAAIESDYYLYMDCSSKYYGGPGRGSHGVETPLTISLANGISEIEFCRYSQDFIGGFRVTSRDGEMETIGCTTSNNIWDNVPMSFAESEEIVQLDIYTQNFAITRVNITTSDNRFYTFESGASFNAAYTKTLQGNKIISITPLTHYERYLNSLKLQFEDCE